MKTHRLVLAMVIGGSFIAGAAVSTVWNNPVSAQGSVAASAVGRFQLQAYATGSGESVQQGCYILDTTNGNLWHAGLGSEAQSLVKRLPQ